MDRELAARIGAKWWTDQLTRKSKQNSGDFLTSAMASWAENEIRKINPLTSEKLAVFQSCLEASLLALIQETEETVGVDYGPDKVLKEAATKADISELHFPIKTIMWLEPDSVKVSLGYKGQIKEITDND